MPVKKDTQSKIPFNHEQLPERLTGEYDIDFSAIDLFGHHDAAYEDIGLLQSYNVPRNDCEEFFDIRRQFMILCAPKGTGKTTICRLWQLEIDKGSDTFSDVKFDTEISPDLKNVSLTEWIKAWKQQISIAILNLIDPEICKNIHIAELVTLSEKKGNRRKHLSDLLLENYETLVIDKQVQKEITARILSKLEDIRKYNLWIFLDEIDQNFTKDQDSIKKVAGMLLAGKEMTGHISNFYLRTTIKPNVLAILLSQIDNISNLRELVVTLSWDDNGIRAILARRIESYLERNGFYSKNLDLFPENEMAKKEEWLIGQVFSTSNFDLGKHNRPPHKILALLAFRRPRWLLDLCITVTKGIKQSNKQLIKFEQVESRLPDYGNARIVDLISEYGTQCLQLNSIINSFYNGRSSYRFFELLSVINDNILSKIKVEIIGVSSECNARQIAKFLFEIAFIEPIKFSSIRAFDVIHFDEHPNFIDNEPMNDKIESEFYWVIHPSFRKTLFLNQRSNDDIRNPQKKN